MNRRKNTSNPPVVLMVLCMMGMTAFAMNAVLLLEIGGRENVVHGLLIVAWARITGGLLAFIGIWRMRRWGIWLYTALTAAAIPYDIFVAHRITILMVLYLVIPIVFINIVFRYYDKMR